MVICLQQGANYFHVVQLIATATWPHLSSLKSKWFDLSGAGLPTLSWKKSLLNKSLSVCLSVCLPCLSFCLFLPKENLTGNWIVEDNCCKTNTVKASKWTKKLMPSTGLYPILIHQLTPFKNRFFILISHTMFSFQCWYPLMMPVTHTTI